MVLLLFDVDIKNKKGKKMLNNIFKSMVLLQHNFNLQVDENYLERKFNWNNAIIAESGEMLESLGYKWWKHQEVDMDNVKVEAIDLLHFVISDTIQRVYNCNLEYLDGTINEFESHFLEIVDYPNFKQDLSLVELVNELNYNDYERLFIMKKIFKTLNMSNEDIFIAYVVKNCLNKFRQEYGYKEGTYHKIWNGKEDNIVAYELANKIGAKENLFAELFNDLKKIYAYCVIPENKTILDDVDYLLATETQSI